jgi:hypothetical protein
MRDAVLAPPDQATIEYAQNVVAASLEADKFNSNPSGAAGLTIIQNTPREIIMIWDGIVTGDTSITYTGVTPGFVTPQTIAY